MSYGKVCGGCCCGCNGNTSEKSILVNPILGQKFQVKLKADNSYQGDVFLCIASDDRTVIGKFLTRQDQTWYKGRTVVFQRHQVEDFFLNARTVLSHILNNV